MDRLQLCASIALAACVALSGCNASTTPSPTPQVANVSGDYLGTMTDTQGGTGAVSGTLAQNGSNAGGSMTVKQTGGTINAQLSLSITTSNTLGGAMVIDYPNGTTCTFSTSAAYTNNGTNTAVIAGSYTAVTNCAGDTGTYTLNQQCTDTVTSDRRTMSFPVKC